MTHDGYCHYDPWWILPLWPMMDIAIMTHDGYYHYGPWFIMLFRTMTDITKFYGLWLEILYHRLLGSDGYCHFPKTMTHDSLCYFGPVMDIIFQGLWPEILFYHFLGCDGYCLVYVTLYSYVSLTVIDKISIKINLVFLQGYRRNFFLGEYCSIWGEESWREFF
jgi:hypothetical protein